jgi:hypothetical protein
MSPSSGSKNKPNKNPECKQVATSAYSTLKMETCSFETSVDFQRTTRRYILEDRTLKIKSRLNSGNACSYVVHNLSFCRLLSKNVKIQIRTSIFLPVVLYGCEALYLTRMKEHRLRICGPETEVTREREIYTYI